MTPHGSPPTPALRRATPTTDRRQPGAPGALRRRTRLRHRRRRRLTRCRQPRLPRPPPPSPSPAQLPPSLAPPLPRPAPPAPRSPPRRLPTLDNHCTHAKAPPVSPQQRASTPPSAPSFARASHKPLCASKGGAFSRLLGNLESHSPSANLRVLYRGLLLPVQPPPRARRLLRATLRRRRARRRSRARLPRMAASPPRAALRPRRRPLRLTRRFPSPSGCPFSWASLWADSCCSRSPLWRCVGGGSARRLRRTLPSRRTPLRFDGSRHRATVTVCPEASLAAITAPPRLPRSESAAHFHRKNRRTRRCRHRPPIADAATVATSHLIHSHAADSPVP